jgi:hypothetical protein
VAVCLVGWSASTRPPRGTEASLHRFTAPLEFDFAGWTLEAAFGKVSQAALSDSGYLTPDGRPALVRLFFQRLDEADRLAGDLNAAYASGRAAAPQTTVTRDGLADVRRQIADLQPAAESILEQQASVILADAGLAALGSPFPPVSFHLSQLPVALVVSPRAEIRQEALIQLNPGLALEGQIQLEGNVEKDLDVSALVVPGGGSGTYPTMTPETGAQSWVSEVVLHEWTHNWLAFRPLGWNYDTSPALRTMNETTAQLIGQALGRRLLARYYPDLVSAAVHVAAPRSTFDFPAEMHATRVHVDDLLAQGRVAEAEAYMEQRRQVFVENGYSLRRLNQAYFAFYGAYAEAPEGAAGEDPIGAAVRQLWQQAESPTSFLHLMSRMDSVADLEQAVGRSLTTP